MGIVESSTLSTPTKLTKILISLIFFGGCLSPSLADPTIFSSSDPVSPGEAVLVIGDQLSSVVNIKVERIADQPSDQPQQDQSQEAVIFPIRKDDQSIFFKIPNDFSPGIYRYRLLSNRTTQVAEGLLNCPTIYWTQGDQGRASSAGGWVRIFGKNIGRVPQVSATLIGHGGTRLETLYPDRSDLWDALFKLPENVQPGIYELRLWNGNGDSAAQSVSVEIEIRQSVSADTPTFNVMNYGARGDGVTDDMQAINDTLSAAKNAGSGVVYFPQGRYFFSGAISIPSFVTLRGERRDLVSLVWPDFAVAPENIIDGIGNFTIEDLSLYVSNHRHVISGGFSKSSEGRRENITIRRVTIRASAFRGHQSHQEILERQKQQQDAGAGPNGANSIRLSGENLQVVDCDVYGSSSAFYLERVRGGFIAHNKFYNGRGWYSIAGTDGLIFEDNEIFGADLTSAGGGISPLYGSNGASQNLFFARNKFMHMHGSNGEALTSDGPGGFYYGSVLFAADHFVALSKGTVSEPVRWTGAAVFILGGRGMGQFAVVDRVEENKVYLDRVWQVKPDQTSIITITAMQKNYIFYANKFYDAGVAVQFFGTSINHIVANNISIRTGGFIASGRWYDHYQPSWYTQFLDNEVVEGIDYKVGQGMSGVIGDAVLGAYGFQRAPNEAPLALGIILRRNKLDSTAHIEVKGGDAKHPGIAHVLIEGNIVKNVHHSLTIDGGVKNVLSLDNHFN